MKMEPTSNDTNGHDSRGKFAKGNTGGPGNPHVRQMARLWETLLRTVKLDDIKAVIEAMHKKVKGGVGLIAGFHRLTL